MSQFEGQSGPQQPDDESRETPGHPSADFPAAAGGPAEPTGYGSQAGYAQAPPPPAYDGGPAIPPGTSPAPYSGAPGLPALPAGVTLATQGRRIGAYFLGGLLYIVTLGIGYLIWGAIVWGRGTSPALGVLGMRCVDRTTGRPVGWGTMALRDIVGVFVQGILGPITALISFVLFLITDERQSIPDKIASTIVVHDPQRALG